MPHLMMFRSREDIDYKRLCMAFICPNKERLENNTAVAFQHSSSVPEKYEVFGEGAGKHLFTEKGGSRNLCEIFIGFATTFST